MGIKIFDFKYNLNTIIRSLRQRSESNKERFIIKTGSDLISLKKLPVKQFAGNNTDMLVPM